MKSREILEKESLCIEEHAPFCMAECPVHLDVPMMMALVQNNDFDQAHELFKKSVLFPNTVSQYCNGPCQQKCKRTQIDASIQINCLEKAIIAYGNSEPIKIAPKIKMKKEVALIGDGICAMSIASVLLEKGFPMTLYFENNGMERENKDFDFIFDSDIIIKDHVNITKESFVEELNNTYDGVYFSNITKEGYESRYGQAPSHFFFTKVCASVIYEISYGKQMATSMDRFLKKVSMSAGRFHEDSYESKLVTSLANIDYLEKTRASGPLETYTKEEAVKEAARCIGCRCMECVKQCKFLEKYEKYPKKYIREIFNNISTGGIGFRTGKPMINSCSMCGLCGEICVNNIPMNEIYKSAREILVKINAMPPRYHDFPLRDMLYSNSDKTSFFRHAPGEESSNYLFFPGCQLSAMKGEYINPMYEYFRVHLGSRVGLMLGCCGAPAAWSGRKDLYEQTMESFQRIWEEAGKPTIITACPTCHREFTETLKDAQVETVWSIYDRFPLPQESLSKPPSNQQTLSIHDPCTTRHQDAMHLEIRSILKKLNYEIEELKYAKNLTRCCGYGGVMVYADADLAKSIIDERLKESDQAYMTYCTVCRDFLADEKKPVFHILDAIYGNMSIEEGLKKGKGISEKVENRALLKKALLKNIWNEEDHMPKEEYESIAIVLSKEAKGKMEERLILEENVKQVIYEAEKTGAKMVKPENGHFLACLRPGIITYWVEYQKDGGVYYVYSAYSHRIQILED